MSHSKDNQAVGRDLGLHARLGRPSVQELDEIMGTPFRVLDAGFVRLVDYMGDDSSIVQAARVSYGVGTKRVQDDRGLIRYLLRHAHTTPFEMCEIKLHVRVPMDVWRQWIRHRTANVNEYSTRYSVAIETTQATQEDQWRTQSSENRQGSTGFVSSEIGQELSRAEGELHRIARKTYGERLAAGVAREQARKDLPLSTYTEAYWKIDLHNLLHFLSVRMEPHAQKEIRDYATTIGESIVAKWVPVAWEAFVDYKLSALSLSRIEVAIISALIAGSKDQATAAAEKNGLLRVGENRKLTASRERAELEMKLRAFGLVPPWSSGE